MAREEGRLYRFPSSDAALMALLLYSTGLGIGRREARRLAGLPIFTRPRREHVRQAAGMMVGAVLLLAAAGAFVLPGSCTQATHAPGDCRSGPAADVEGGSGRSQRQRRHELHAHASRARSERSPTGSTGSTRRPLRLSRDRRVLPSGRREARRTAGPPLGVPHGRFRAARPERLVVVVGPARL